MRFFRRNGEKAGHRGETPQTSGGAPVSTWIGAEARMEGRIASDSDICIEGGFDGVIEASAEVLISEGAEVRARVSAKSVVVVGSLEGPIEASELAEIGAGGRMVGDIQCDRVAVRPGAEFEGSIASGEPVSGEATPEASGSTR